MSTEADRGSPINFLPCSSSPGTITSTSPVGSSSFEFPRQKTPFKSAHSEQVTENFIAGAVEDIDLSVSTSAAKKSSELLQSEDNGDSDGAYSHSTQVSHFNKQTRPRPSHNSKHSGSTGRPTARKNVHPKQYLLEHVFNSSPGFGSSPHPARPNTHRSQDALHTACGHGSYQQSTNPRASYPSDPQLKIEMRAPVITIFVGPRPTRFDVFQQQLAMHCPILYATYMSGNPSEPVILPGADPVTFQKVVTWVRQQRILDLSHYARSSDPFGMLINLYGMAHDYQMGPLKDECLVAMDGMREMSERVPNVGNLGRIARILRCGVHRGDHDVLRRKMWAWYAMYYPEGVPGVSAAMRDLT